MFEDSLVESSGRLSARRPWATAASFAVQSVVIASLLLLSLVYTESLPSQRWIDVLQVPPPPPSTAPGMRTVASAGAKGSASQSPLIVPREIPRVIERVRDGNLASSQSDGVFGDVPGGISVPGSGEVMDVLGRPGAPMPKLAIQKVRVSSGVAQGLLIRQVNPQYPSPARLARIEGKVVLQALIGKDGTIQNLRVISGHPMLTGAAMDAVKQWLYKPYYLNGEPVEVETMINVNFNLAP
jgi:periplasmic protein TonB